MAKDDKTKAEILAFFKERRDWDIYTLFVVSERINTIYGAHFILTGSYSIEGLVGSCLPQHNDMDANIYVIDLQRDLSIIADSIAKISSQGEQIYLLERTAHRLDYNVALGTDQANPRKLELQFYEASCVSETTGDQATEFILRSHHGRKTFRVPTVAVFLENSEGRKRLFRVKSLPYAVATWAIRISGLAVDPKRSVRASDLDSFCLLLTTNFSYEDVFSAMRGHPQMPESIKPEQVFEQALRKLPISVKKTLVKKD